MKKAIFLLLTVFVFILSAKAQNLQFGVFGEWKDEFFLAPGPNIKYVEFYSISANGFIRASEKRFGVEGALGFEKSFGAYYKELDNYNTFNYHELNRISLTAMPFVYVMNKPKNKIDLGLGLKYYVNLNNELTAPMPTYINYAKIASKFEANYTHKKFQMGLFAEYDILTDFEALPKPISFGVRFGYLGL